MAPICGLHGIYSLFTGAAGILLGFGVNVSGNVFISKSYFQ